MTIKPRFWIYLVLIIFIVFNYLFLRADYEYKDISKLQQINNKNILIKTRKVTKKIFDNIKSHYKRGDTLVVCCDSLLDLPDWLPIKIEEYKLLKSNKNCLGVKELQYMKNLFSEGENKKITLAAFSPTIWKLKNKKNILFSPKNNNYGFVIYSKDSNDGIIIFIGSSTIFTNPIKKLADNKRLYDMIIGKDSHSNNWLKIDLTADLIKKQKRKLRENIIWYFTSLSKKSNRNNKSNKLVEEKNKENDQNIENREKKDIKRGKGYNKLEKENNRETIRSTDKDARKNELKSNAHKKSPNDHHGNNKSSEVKKNNQKKVYKANILERDKLKIEKSDLKLQLQEVFKPSLKNHQRIYVYDGINSKLVWKNNLEFEDYKIPLVRDDIYSEKFKLILDLNEGNNQEILLPTPSANSIITNINILDGKIKKIEKNKFNQFKLSCNSYSSTKFTATYYSTKNYFNSLEDIEFKYSSLNQFPASKYPLALLRKIIPIINKKIKITTNKKLLVKRIVKWLRNFSSDRSDYESLNRLDQFCSKEVGACRHRSLIFFIIANHFNIPTRYVGNNVHAFVEIWNGNYWTRIDLGGVEVEMITYNLADNEEYKNNYTIKNYKITNRKQTGLKNLILSKLKDLFGKKSENEECGERVIKENESEKRECSSNVASNLDSGNDQDEKVKIDEDDLSKESGNKGNNISNNERSLVSKIKESIGKHTKKYEYLTKDTNYKEDFEGEHIKFPFNLQKIITWINNNILLFRILLIILVFLILMIVYPDQFNFENLIQKTKKNRL